MSAEPVLSRVENQAGPSSLPRVGYSMAEAKKITGLGRTTLYEAISDGRLKCFKVGRRTLFSLKHLEDFMALYDTEGQHIEPVRKRRKK
jgi:excisionase family DNA binding protein